MQKKYLVPILACMATAIAHAQSHVQLYGVLDAGVTYVNNKGGAGTVVEDTGVMQGNRWGLRGTEDLGDGLKAIFLLENGFSLNNGALGQGGREFGRQAFVGLASASAGQLTFGRQYDFMRTALLFDTAAVQVSTAYSFHFLDADRIAGERVDNAVRYVTPNLGGLKLGALYGFSNVPGAFAGTTTAPRIVSFGATYRRGALALDAAYTNANGRTGSLATQALGGDSLRTMGLGGRYYFHRLTAFGNITSTRVANVSGGGNAIIDNYELGAVYQWTSAVSYGGGYTYTTYAGHPYHQINTTIDYHFSKSTDVYFGAFFQHSNSTRTGAGLFLIASPGSFRGFSSSENQFATRIGIRHRF